MQEEKFESKKSVSKEARSVAIESCQWKSKATLHAIMQSKDPQELAMNAEAMNARKSNTSF